METETPKTGIDVIGDIVAWGTHFCLFYETKEDLFDTMVSYCKSGLEDEEYCLWVVAESFTIEEARDALEKAVPELDRHLADSNLELARPATGFRRKACLTASERDAIGMRDSLGQGPDVTAACEPPGIRPGWEGRTGNTGATSKTE